MKFSEHGRMAISRAYFWFFITELVTRNPTMGISALEDGLFMNLLIFDYLCLYIQVSAHVSGQASKRVEGNGAGGRRVN